MIKLKSVDDALNELLDIFSPAAGSLDSGAGSVSVSVRIQDIAKQMHYQCWRYRDLILTEIHEWAEQHHHNSLWTDAHGRVFKIGYQHQDPPAAYRFSRRGTEDILLLVMQEVNK